jgi:acyl-CoA reductase-like NAD-dependent aldehyde dehydrogenase
MSIAREEIFGPVLSVLAFDQIDQAFKIANGTMYGLPAGVWTRNLDKAFRLARGLRAGTDQVNTCMAGTPELPLSGHRESGLGHERGRFCGAKSSPILDAPPATDLIAREGVRSAIRG